MCKQPNFCQAECVPGNILCKARTLTVCLALFQWTTALAADPSSGGDPQLLQRIRSKVAAHLSQLHNYTCHVVIDRLVRPISRTNFGHQDTLELEVAFVNGRELFSHGGATNFDEQPVSQLVPGGLIGNDAFGSHDDDVFSNDRVCFKYAGTCKKDGHKTFRYNFYLPQESSRLMVKQNNSPDVAVGYKGSFWVDSETLEMVRLEWKTDHIPRFVGLSSVQKSMRYRRVRIGNSEFVLPHHSELASFDDSGNYRLNIVNLERCLEFTGSSVVSYDAPTEDTSAQIRRSDRRRDR